LACTPATPFHVGAPPVLSVPPTTLSISTRTVSPAAVVAARVIGDVPADVRERTVDPKVWAMNYLGCTHTQRGSGWTQDDVTPHRDRRERNV
jgi:hypothetical protein